MGFEKHATGFLAYAIPTMSAIGKINGSALAITPDFAIGLSIA